MVSQESCFHGVLNGAEISNLCVCSEHISRKKERVIIYSSEVLLN